jgi:outer membrane protein assembly factor BamE (lipoprotein component of BamABCDE complex)
MKPVLRLAVCGLALAVAACVPAADQARDVNAGQGAQDRLTLGTVQREIHVGMSGADVVGALGSPNLVTTDEHRRETWVYDRIATEQVYSSSAGGVNALFLAGVSGRTGATQTSQRTLTVIIRYDEAGKVRDFSYRSSSF